MGVRGARQVVATCSSKYTQRLTSRHVNYHVRFMQQTSKMPKTSNCIYTRKQKEKAHQNSQHKEHLEFELFHIYASKYARPYNRRYSTQFSSRQHPWEDYSTRLHRRQLGHHLLSPWYPWSWPVLLLDLRVILMNIVAFVCGFLALRCMQVISLRCAQRSWG